MAILHRAPQQPPGGCRYAGLDPVSGDP